MEYVRTTTSGRSSSTSSSALQGANFLLVRVDGDAHELCSRLLERDVMVRDFALRPGVEGCFRVTVGAPAENDEFLAAIRAALPEVVA